jgi:hypothetical protein
MMTTMTVVSRSETEGFSRKYRENAQDVAGVPDAVVQFTKVEEYTSFLAEYADVDGNFIIHFFPPKEAYSSSSGSPKVSQEFILWWQRKFPEILSPAAEGYFKATRPTLTAQYIPEMQSWWMRAGGFARRLGAKEFVEGFFAELDRQVDSFAASSART